MIDWLINFKHDLQREVIESVKELEVELRRQKRSVEVDVLFELSEELELFPSKYQRPDMLLSGLKAQPFWTMEESGFGPELNKIVDGHSKTGSVPTPNFTN